MQHYRRNHLKHKIHSIKPKKSIFKKLWFWILVLAIIIFCSAVYVVFFYPGFQIKNIVVLGNQKIEAIKIQSVVSSDVNKKIFGLGPLQISSKSIFLINKNALTTGILKDFPEIGSLSVNIEYPQTLSLNISERKPVGIFCDNEQKCFLIDGAGVIFEKLSQNPDNMVIVRQTVNKEALTGENIIGQNIIEALLKIQKDLKDNFKIDLEEALLTTPTRMNVKTEENWQIYFDLSEGSSIDMQLTKLDLLLSGDITPNIRNKIEYIDLRFEDRAYYK